MDWLKKFGDQWIRVEGKTKDLRKRTLAMSTNCPIKGQNILFTNLGNHENFLWKSKFHEQNLLTPNHSHRFRKKIPKGTHCGNICRKHISGKVKIMVKEFLLHLICYKNDKRHRHVLVQEPLSSRSKSRRLFLDEIDEDHSGTVDLNEFVTMMTGWIQPGHVQTTDESIWWLLHDVISYSSSVTSYCIWWHRESHLLNDVTGV